MGVLLHFDILVVVIFCLLQGRILHFLASLQLFFFRVIRSSGVFRLSVTGKARFLPVVQTICRFEIFIRKS